MLALAVPCPLRPFFQFTNFTATSEPQFLWLLWWPRGAQQLQVCSEAFPTRAACHPQSTNPRPTHTLTSLRKLQALSVWAQSPTRSTARGQEHRRWADSDLAAQGGGKGKCRRGCEPGVGGPHAPTGCTHSSRGPSAHEHCDPSAPAEP